MVSRWEFAVRRRARITVFCATLAVTVAALRPSTAQAYYEQPSSLEVSLDSSYISVSFSWAATLAQPAGTAVGFRSDQALEFEVHVADRCLIMPPLGGGRDETIDPTVVGVLHNLPEGSGDAVYVDVWNYYVPPSTLVGRADAGGTVRALCTGSAGAPTVFAAAAAYLINEGVTRDSDANLAVGLRRPDLLVRGVPYHFLYPVQPASVGDTSGCVETVATSRFSVQFSLFPNQCTVLGGAFTTNCPFFIGAPGCAEHGTVGGEWHSLFARICAPTDVDPRVVPTPVTTPMMDYGLCDRDSDTWFAMTDVTSGLPMYGSHALDCDDSAAAAHPGPREISCTDRLDRGSLPRRTSSSAPGETSIARKQSPS